MAKTHKKYLRFYADGVDLSGDARGLGGSFEWNWDADLDASWTDECRNVIHGTAEVKMGSLSAFFNADAGGVHSLAAAGGYRTVMVPIGLMAAPVAGNPCWCGVFNEISYKTAGEKTLGVTLELGGVPASQLSRVLNWPWGYLLHAKAARTAVNSGNYDVDGGAASNFGGVGYLQIFATNGTCTFRVEQSATGSGGWTTLLTFDAAGSAVGAEAKATAALTTPVSRYLRWQIALGTATSVTFAMAFCRRTWASM